MGSGGKGPLELAATGSKQDVLDGEYAETQLVGGEKPAEQSPRELMGLELGLRRGMHELSG